MAYRTMENYLWLGLNASSYLDKEHTKVLSSFATGRESFRVKEEDHEVVEDFWLRHTNTKDLNKYINGERLNKSSTIEMTHKDYLIEKFFLKLRTNQWIKDLSEFTEILVPNYQEKIKNYEKEWFIEISSATRDPRPSSLCRLTDAGMDVFNTIVTDLMQEI
jgi:coproporphyrinogen III oxidase-like Fe-S oxidoreductase